VNDEEVNGTTVMAGGVRLIGADGPTMDDGGNGDADCLRSAGGKVR